jgi:hypothetical protein
MSLVGSSTGIATVTGVGASVVAAVGTAAGTFRAGSTVPTPFAAPRATRVYASPRTRRARRL